MNEENKQQQQGGMTAEAKPNGEYNFEEALQKAVEKCQTSQIEALMTFFKDVSELISAYSAVFDAKLEEALTRQLTGGK